MVEVVAVRIAAVVIAVFRREVEVVVVMRSKRSRRRTSDDGFRLGTFWVWSAILFDVSLDRFPFGAAVRVRGCASL